MSKNEEMFSKTPLTVGLQQRKSCKTNGKSSNKTYSKLSQLCPEADWSKVQSKVVVPACSKGLQSEKILLVFSRHTDDPSVLALLVDSRMRKVLSVKECSGDDLFEQFQEEDSADYKKKKLDFKVLIGKDD